MDATAAYPDLVCAVSVTAALAGISSPMHRLWTYCEQLRMFDAVDARLCVVVSQDRAFRSTLTYYRSELYVTINASLSPIHFQEEIYRQLFMILAPRMFAQECVNDPSWALTASKVALRHLQPVMHDTARNSRIPRISRIISLSKSPFIIGLCYLLSLQFS